MQDILLAQKFLLSINAALIPISALIYSMFNSWHCAVMCGPLVLTPKVKQMHRLLLFRLVSYTCMGALIGFAGKTLRNMLEFDLFKVFAFVLFVLITALFVFPKIFPHFWRVSPQHQWSYSVRGALFAIVPCHLLFFFYGLATLTTSVFWGGALLFGHAVMTMPALSYAGKWANHAVFRSPYLRGAIRLFLFSLILFNLFYFAGHLFHPSEDLTNHLLFCW